MSSPWRKKKESSYDMNQALLSSYRWSFKSVYIIYSKLEIIEENILLKLSECFIESFSGKKWNSCFKQIGIHENSKLDN